ncbi:hypothetical protein KR093_010989 [Drosophila rubida]|uniref:Uncharacterized protein n=1 Tax=Drosophila rubida TaxID=30044 RepID=A0AAD4JZ26_9MUSC|nr:hypothetical protein KR093_010989 [Drosophila rubida]
MAEVCRICMDESDGHLDIFGDQGETAREPSLLDMLNECVAHKVQRNDPLPKKICSSCVSDCLNAFRFRRVCEESYQLFMELLDDDKSSSQNAESIETEIDLDRVKIEKLDSEIKVENTLIADDSEDDNPMYSYYYCHLCKKKYVHLEKLNLHLKVHQEMLQAFRCRYCEKKFAKRSYLNAHMRFHTGNGKPYTCPHCPRAFAGRQDLDEHIASYHMTPPEKIEETYLERQVEKSARQQESKLSGQLPGHNDDEQPPYTCPHCSKVCQKRWTLEAHIRTHTAEQRRIECPICLKEFLLVQQLKQHMLLHADENPFPCPHCPKAFKRSSNLQSHLRTHSVERPFGCPHCDKTFNHPANLEMHLRIHPKSQR